jgi:hypothetical protein
MASDGRRVFLLGGRLSPGTEVAEAELIHVLDTGMYFLFVISFGKPSSLKQSSLFSRDPTPTLSTLLRRPLNTCGSRQRVSRRARARPGVNHNTQAGYSLHQMLGWRTVLFLPK